MFQTVGQNEGGAFTLTDYPRTDLMISLAIFAQIGNELRVVESPVSVNALSSGLYPGIDRFYTNLHNTVSNRFIRDSVNHLTE